MAIYRSIVIATTLALALGLTRDAVGSRGAGHPAGATAQPPAAAFHQPQIDGMNIDTRLMAHMRADPTQTAERFCRDMGYPEVAELVIRPSTMTRTIADGAAQAERGQTKQAFSLIVCRSHDAAASATG